jgi:hypothetical protein
VKAVRTGVGGGEALQKEVGGGDGVDGEGWTGAELDLMQSLAGGFRKLDLGRTAPTLRSPPTQALRAPSQALRGRAQHPPHS